jgi:hypothetical protein
LAQIIKTNSTRPETSGRGEFDAGSGRCVCQKPYGGPNCLQGKQEGAP